jgi:hypothetical protein
MRRLANRIHAASLAAVVTLAGAALLAGPVASSSAFEGPFCSPHYLDALGGFCQSLKRENVRRSVGRSEGGYTEVYIYGVNGEQREKGCEFESCEVGTGYMAHKQDGVGVIENIGDHGHTYYGYLYP